MCSIVPQPLSRSSQENRYESAQQVAVLVPVLTRNGHAAAVLISPEDLAQLEETIDVLSDPATL
ncbi:MAG: type II toxin-antitoxin system Phd/YefM family antitoxin, partial [Streptosporangiaceae bacterium]